MKPIPFLLTAVRYVGSLRVLSGIVRAATGVPYGQMVAVVQRDGCMAHDWRILRRGRIIASEQRKVYGTVKLQTFYTCRRHNGTEFEVWADRCMPAPTPQEEQEFHERAGENLGGYLVEFV